MTPRAALVALAERQPRQLTAPPAAPAGRKTAFRCVDGLYPRDQIGAVAHDGSVLDRPAGDGKHAFASPWRLECGCFRTELLELVPASEARWRCPDHVRAPRPVLADADEPRFPWLPGEREAAEERAWAPIAEEWGIGDRLRRVRLEDLDPSRAVHAVKTFVLDDARHCVVIAGPTGVGKSTAAVAAFRQLAVWGAAAPAVYFSEPSLMRQLIGQESAEAMDDAIGADLLLIDDVGLGYRKPGGLAEGLIEEILCEREAREAQTVLTTNLTSRRFAQVLGDRVADRILNGPWGRWIDVPGDTMRRKAPRRG